MSGAGRGTRCPPSRGEGGRWRRRDAGCELPALPESELAVGLPRVQLAVRPPCSEPRLLTRLAQGLVQGRAEPVAVVAFVVAELAADEMPVLRPEEYVEQFGCPHDAQVPAARSSTLRCSFG